MTIDTSPPAEVPTGGLKATTAQRLKQTVRSILGEPLLHFLVLGALLFVLNAVISPEVPKERLIEVTPDVRRFIVETFVSERQRDPTPEEVERLIDGWIMNEITYRESLAQGLDKGDDMIRERVMQKMRLLIFSNITAENPTDAQLTEWLDAHRAQFDVPEQLSFFEVPVGGPESQAEAEDILRQIETGSEPESIRLRAHTFVQRPRGSVELVFGKDFVAKLTALPLHKWQALPSPEGWHLVRLEKVVPSRAVTIDEVRGPLVGDWQQERGRERAVQTVQDMGKSYVVKRSDLP